jgi:hypothetical protein
VTPLTDSWFESGYQFAPYGPVVVAAFGGEKF